MFCKNCGAEIKDNQKFCKKCGFKIAGNDIQEINVEKQMETVAEETNDLQKNEKEHTFLFGERFNGRSQITTVLKWVDKIGGTLLGLYVLYFIYVQIQLKEHYVFTVYVMRFMIEFAPLLAPLEIIGSIYALLAYEEKDLKRLNSKWILFGCHMGYILVNVIIAIPFIVATDLVITKWVLQLAVGGTGELLYEFRMQIVALIIGTGINIFKSRLVEEEKEA